MVDVAVPLSMHRTLSANQAAYPVGAFVQSSYDPPPYGSRHHRASSRPHSPAESLLPSAYSLTAPTLDSLHTPPPDMSEPQLNSLPLSSYQTHPNTTFRNDAAPASCQQSRSIQVCSGMARSRPSHSLNGIDESRSRPHSPASRRPSRAGPELSHRKQNSGGGAAAAVAAAAAIAPSLQIPSTINDSKGSLAEFAAQMTCLFWFESSFVLHRVEDTKDSPYPTTPLVPEAIPSLGFRKWVLSILSITQVTQEVILLALLFIYRLKKLNPTVKGKPGSEFRLLTVALMLGNKFLDDNTYTNKTWGEVSGISVQEIHIMEVEFLSNMRYSLYTSEGEWLAWHTKLGKFWKHFDRASRVPLEAPPRASVSSASTSNLPPTLPSPPSSNHASPPFAANYSPSNSGYSYPLAIPTYLVPTMPSPASSIPEVGMRASARKRSHDGGSDEPPQKRMLRSAVQNSQAPRANGLTPSHTPGFASNVPRLPAPTLSYSTPPSASGYVTAAPAQLPHPSGRAMSMVYPSTQPAQNPLASNGARGSLVLQTQPMTHNAAANTFGDQSRRQSPYPTTSSGSSPNSAIYPGQLMTQVHSSPSYFLTHRNSPYRPVRGVSTLLVSPPSGTMHNPPQILGLDRMHYQPLGKARSEYKTGVVPYLHHDAWPQMQQMQEWPPLPQPNYNV